MNPAEVVRQVKLSFGIGRLDRISGGALEDFEAQALFDPLKK